MTQEEKNLLLKDLCARLSYNFVYCYCNAPLADGKPIVLTPVIISNLMNAAEDLVIKPYLRPMSSMTEEEKKEWHYLYLPLPHKNEASETERRIDYLNEHHFDYRGLIPIGLALEAPVGMYKTE